jgi:pimeloyl-ACP methyl ester carboxylesterase
LTTQPPNEADLRAAIRDPRYWQAGHPGRAAHVAAVTRGFQHLYGSESAEGDGGTLVHVRAHDRVVDGRRQHVDAYTQLRQRRSSDETSAAEGPESRQAPEAARAEAGPRPVVIFVGGAGDGTFRNVQRFFDDFKRSYPGHETHYFSHDQGLAIRNFVDSLPQSTRISLVGHSWGGDTAAQTAAALGAAGRQVDTLVTIDPVGRGTSAGFFNRVRAGTGHWVNVNASGTGSLALPNIIAGLGGEYGRGPSAHAHVFLEMPKGHEDFGGMMRTPGPDGLAPLDTILGLRAPR